MSNLELWNKVSVTDPKYTKAYKGKGGFDGTAICAQWQRWKATELWGPFGGNWGVTDEVFEIKQYGDEYTTRVLVYSGVLYYPDGKVGIHADIDLWSYSRQYKTWNMVNEAHKKVSTNALTKGLSTLGFSADVFLGKFDDNQYVAQQAKKHREQEQKETMQDNQKKLKEWTARLDEQTQREALREVTKDALNVFKALKDKEGFNEVMRLAKIKANELEQLEARSNRESKVQALRKRLDACKTPEDAKPILEEADAMDQISEHCVHAYARDLGLK